MVGSIRLPSSAVVAMVEPEIAENTVPATMAMTESRPGTRRISSANASIALSATPVWNSTSPISTKNGIGVSAKLVIDCTALRASCARPGSPPRKISAPRTLIARNANATGSPPAMTATRPPNRSSAASPQGMGSTHRRGFAPRRALVEHAVEAKHELDHQQRERDGQRHQHPPFREDEILDGDRAAAPAVIGHGEAVANQHDADRAADHVARRLEQHSDARRQHSQHQVEPDVLAASQQPRGG